MADPLKVKEQKLLEAEYRRVRKNAQAQLRRADKSGIDVSVRKAKLPKIPKTITAASIRRLQNFQKGTTAAVKQQRKKINTAKKKAGKIAAQTLPTMAFNDTVITQFSESLRQYSSRTQTLMNNWIKRLIKSRGVDAVAQMLEDAARAGLRFMWQYSYDDALRQEYMENVLNYLPDVGDMEKEDIMQSVEDDITQFDYDDGE